jgi:hypothetical protein
VENIVDWTHAVSFYERRVLQQTADTALRRPGEKQHDRELIVVCGLHRKLFTTSPIVTVSELY